MSDITLEIISIKKFKLLNSVLTMLIALFDIYNVMFDQLLYISKLLISSELIEARQRDKGYLMLYVQLDQPSPLIFK